MTLIAIDPLQDDRWVIFTQNEKRTSVFHRREWLQSLFDTYDYKPFVITSTAGRGPISDGVVFCDVSSWLTGNRIVGLPFSDHCDPLFGPELGLGELTEWMGSKTEGTDLRFIELRPSYSNLFKGPNVHSSGFYWLHVLDLRPSLEEIRSRMHKSSFSRRIKRAESAGLEYQLGNSKQLLDEFYGLLLRTRRRHLMVPQPFEWFENLSRNFGDLLQIRVARSDTRPIAAILTLRHNSRVYYKYGCSDAHHHNLGAMPFLFWSLIRECKSTGVSEIDLGRSDLDQSGLITFKDHVGAGKLKIEYVRVWNRHRRSKIYAGARAFEFPVRAVVSVLPSFLLPTFGKLLYRHAG